MKKYYPRTLQNYFDDFDEIIYSKDFSQSEKIEKSLVVKKDFLKVFSSDESDDYYFLGYMGYLMKEFSEDTEGYFLKSLELDSDNMFCQYYYGFYLYDTKNVDKAFLIFNQIDLCHLEEIGQLWRAIKIKEMVVCCKLSSKDLENEIKVKKLSEFFKMYNDYVEKDEENLNYPLDIIKCIGEHIEQFGQEFKHVIKELIRLMDIQELNSTYKLEYEKFNNFVA